jgi:hypothetical protein
MSDVEQEEIEQAGDRAQDDLLRRDARLSRAVDKRAGGEVELDHRQRRTR